MAPFTLIGIVQSAPALANMSSYMKIHKNEFSIFLFPKISQFTLILKMNLHTSIVMKRKVISDTL